MNTTFNTIETIMNDATVTNRSAAYLSAAHSFAVQADEIASKSEEFVCKKYAEEVTVAWRKCEGADCEYTAYVNANMAEQWLKKCWNNA